MLYRQLGRTGLKVSAYALGTNSFGGRADEAVSAAIIRHALDHGVNLIDTANLYTEGRSETIIGKAVRGRRHEVVLATKCGLPVGGGPNDRGASRAHILRELEGSLRRLDTDYVDLYQIHTWDGETPLEETLRTLDDLVTQGKVRYVGCSNYAAWQLAKALWTSDRHGWVRYESVQPEYSVADRRIEDELLPLCRDQTVGVLAYFPLAGGILTGKYRPGAPPPPGSRAVTQPRWGDRALNERNLGLAEAFARLAAEAGVAPAQLALAWLMARPGVTAAIVGATRVEQQAENLKAVGLDLDPDLSIRVDALWTAYPMPPRPAA